MRISDPDLAIARLSRSQHGAWSRRQALARGMTPKMIRCRVGRGEWTSLDAAVYAHIAAVPTWERSIMAAVLAEPWATGGRGTRASRTSSATVNEMPRQRRPGTSR